MKNAKQIANNNLYWENLRLVYKDRLINLLYEFGRDRENSLYGMKVTKNESTGGFIFTFWKRDNGWGEEKYDLPGNLPESYEYDIIHSLTELEFTVDTNNAEENEAKRKAAIKAAALSKLTDEEKKVLGL